MARADGIARLVPDDPFAEIEGSSGSEGCDDHRVRQLEGNHNHGAESSEANALATNTGNGCEGML